MRRTGIYLLVILSLVVGAALVTDAIVVTDRERMDEFVDSVTGQVSESRIDNALRYADPSKVEMELVHDGYLDAPLLVEKVAHNPAVRFAVRDRGFLREGYWADLVLVDPDTPTPVTTARVLSRCGWSPFEGRSFRSRIDATWINGALAWDGERLVEHGAAMALEYVRD